MPQFLLDNRSLSLLLERCLNTKDSLIKNLCHPFHRNLIQIRSLKLPIVIGIPGNTHKETLKFLDRLADFSEEFFVMERAIF
jgi:hypothetical protein